MQWDDLQLLVAVAEAGSLSAVARRLGCTQPAVGQRMRRLEREVGASLLERGRYGVALTTAGSALYEAAVEAKGSLDTALERIRRMRGDERPLRMSIAETLVRRVMIPPLAALRNDYPDLDIHVRGAMSAMAAIDDVQTGVVDMAFMTLDLTPKGLEQHPVVRTPWALVTAPGDPLATCEPLRLEDVNTRRLINNTAYVPGSSTNAILESAFAAEGVNLGRHSRITGWDTQLLMVGAGLGHAIVPSLWLHGENGALVARQLPQLRPLTFGWVCRRWVSLPEAAHYFAERLSEHLATLVGSTGVDVFPPIEAD